MTSTYQNAPAPVVETRRLVMRPPEWRDFDAWAEMSADEESMRYIGGPMPRSLAWRSFASQAGSWALLGFGLFSLIERDTGDWVGCAGPVRPPEWPVHEIGWRLATHARGKGYATEAAEAATDWAFATLGWSQVAHSIHPDNAASIRVAERLGSQPLGSLTLPPPFHELPTACWGQDLESWRRRRAASPAKSA